MYTKDLSSKHRSRRERVFEHPSRRLETGFEFECSDCWHAGLWILFLCYLSSLSLDLHFPVFGSTGKKLTAGLSMLVYSFSSSNPMLQTHSIKKRLMTYGRTVTDSKGMYGRQWLVARYEEYSMIECFDNQKRVESLYYLLLSFIFIYFLFLFYFLLPTLNSSPPHVLSSQLLLGVQCVHDSYIND